MKFTSRLTVLVVALLMALFGLTAAPASAAPKPVSLTQVSATLANNIVSVELTVRCDPDKTYMFQIFQVFQGETVGFNDEPNFLPAPCGTRETQFVSGMTGLFTTGKAQLRAIIYLCEAGETDPTACPTVEIWKDVRLRA